MVGSTRGTTSLPRADHRFNIESSVAVAGNIAYFNQSGGLLQGWDLTPVLNGTGQPNRVFRFWDGDDSDSIREFGLDVVTALCEDLLKNGAPGLHFFTLNQAALTKAIWQRLHL